MPIQDGDLLLVNRNGQSFRETFQNIREELGGNSNVTISATPPADPAEGDLWWNSDDGRLYIFFNDGTSSQWVDASPDGETIAAPVINNVTLGEGSGGTGRFTGATFLVTANMTEDGSPASTKGLKAVVREPVVRALTRPTTTEITNVQTVPFSDDLELGLLNDNTWRDIYWCGEPYNCYIAQGNGTSVDNFATSTDGQNWTRRTATVNGTEWNVEGNFAWSPQDGRLYVVSSESNSGSGSRKAIMFRTTDDSLANAGFDFERTTDPGMPSEGDHAHNGFGDLYWDPVTLRWYAARTSSQNGRSCAFLAGPQSASPAGSWTQIAGIIGSEVGRLMIHADGSGTWSGNGANQSGSLGGNKTAYAPNATTSSGVYWILGNGQEPVGRWAKVGTAGWVCAASTGSSTNLGPRIARHLGDQPPNSTTPTMLDPAVLFAAEGVTEANFRDALWIEDLGIAVICGQASTATRDNHGCLVTTTDAENFTFMWTNAPDDNERYRWDRMFWSDERQELILVAGTGTNPGARAGYTQTAGQTVNMPQLTFVSAAGLDAFAVGTAVEQSDSNANGLIAAIDEDTAQMVIKGTNGAWGPANTGLTVLGPRESYDPAYAIFDADGAVTGLAQFDPGFRVMNGNGPYSLAFPATFDGGTVPDDDIPTGSTIQAEVAAVSEVAGFVARDEAQSNVVTPS